MAEKVITPVFFADSTASARSKSCYQAKAGFVKRSVAGETLLVPTGSVTREFSGMILLNETGDFLWEQLQRPQTQDALVQALLDEFEVGESTAVTDVRKFIDDGVQNGLLGIC